MPLKAIFFYDFSYGWNHGIANVPNTDEFNSLGLKAQGPHKIANILEDNGYPTRVIPHFHYYLKYHINKILDLIDHYKSTLKFIGIGTTFMSFDIRFLEEYKILWDKCAEHNIRIILGGPLRHSDHILDNHNLKYQRIIGYAETSIMKFLESKNTNRIFAYDTKSLTYDFHNCGVAFRSNAVITPRESLPLEVSRGCRFKCKFCGFVLLGRKPTDNYIRHPDRLYEELMHNFEHWKIQNYFMSCDTFNESTEKLRMVQKVVERLPFEIRFAAYLRADLLNSDQDQIHILKDMGLHGATFGIETLNHESGKIIGKGLKPTTLLNVLDIAKEVWGDQVIMHASFIVGLPKDTPKTVTDWIKLVTDGKTALDSAIFRGLSINSSNFEANEEHMSIIDKDPKKYGYLFNETNEQWYNKQNGWNSVKANYIAETVNETMRNNFKIPSWNYVESLGYGFDKKYLNSFTRGDVGYDNFVANKKMRIQKRIEEEALLHFKLD